MGEKPQVIGVRLVDISDDQAGQRVDNFLLARLKGVPKSHIYRLLRKGEVRVNKGRIKPEYRLKAGDTVRIPPVRQAESAPLPTPGAGLRQLLANSVLYEDSDLLVIDKPAGLAVHGGSGVDLGLIEALRAARDEPFLELVHRLDKGTSGCLLVAKKRSALRSLQTQLREGLVKKTYLALVLGGWPKGLETVDAPLLKQNLPSGDNVVRPHVSGKNSVTHFRVLKRYANATLLEVDLETGRTHQIRVHSQMSGYPLVGDDKYGDDDPNRQARRRGLKRMFLHAHRLSFILPACEKRFVIESPLPADLNVYLETL